MKPMEILVFDETENKFKWVTVTTNTPNDVANIFKNSYPTAEKTYYAKHIYDIKNDIRQKYGRCSYCGELVLKTKKAEHGAKMLAKRLDCTKCDWAVLKNAVQTKTTIVPNADGTYTKKIEQVGELRCAEEGSYYRSYNLEDARQPHGICKYNKCTMDTAVKECNDILVNHPDLFKKCASINALIASKRWKFLQKGDYEIKFSLGVTNLVAVCNQYGIISHFTYTRRGLGLITFRYSAKTDKLYRLIDGKYIETTMPEFPDTKSELWKRYIKELYEM